MSEKLSFHTSLSLESHAILDRYSSDKLTGTVITKSTIIEASLKLMDAKIKGDPEILKRYLQLYEEELL